MSDPAIRPSPSRGADALRRQIGLIKAFKIRIMTRHLYGLDEPPRTGEARLRWETRPLSALAAIIVPRRIACPPGTPSSRNVANEESGTMIIDDGCIRSLRFFDGSAARPAPPPPDGPAGVAGADIILALGGEHRGASALVPVFHPGGALGGNCAALRVASTGVEHFYLLNILHYYFNTGFFSAPEDAPPLTPDELATLAIPLPGLEVQRGVSGMMLGLSEAMVELEGMLCAAGNGRP